MIRAAILAAMLVACQSETQAAPAPCVDYICPIGDSSCTCHGGTTERLTPVGRACECPEAKK